MARRKSGYYPRRTSKCHVAHIPSIKTGYVESWCTYHAAYLMDCLICGEHFHSARPHTKYCSTACSQKAYRERKG